MNLRQFSRLGGQARAKKLTLAQRRRISRKAGLASAKKRWGYEPPPRKLMALPAMLRYAAHQIERSGVEA